MLVSVGGSPYEAWIRAGFPVLAPGRHRPDQVDDANDTATAEIRPTPPTAPRCSRNASSAPPPSSGTRPDAFPFVSLPLAAPFPAKCDNCECLILRVQSMELKWRVLRLERSGKSFVF